MARQKWKEWTENKDNLAILAAWARAGLTDEEIADQIGIRRSTLSEWKKKYDEVRTALSTGKEYANRLVEDSLFKMTQGYDVTVKKAFKLRKTEYDGQGRKTCEKEDLEYAEETEHVEPDIKAIMFWLRNRMPDDWKDKIAPKDDGGAGTGVIVLTQTQVRELKDDVRKNEEGIEGRT